MRDRNEEADDSCGDAPGLDGAIEELRAELSGTTGENVVVRRFSRFAVGA